MKMKKLHTLKTVLKSTRADKIIVGFVVFVLLAALVIWIVEPEIPHYLDALWYCYTVFSTVGFGDFVAITWVGRIISILITIYSLFVIAIVTGVVVSYYSERIRIRYDRSKEVILNKLERLPELSKEELEELSETIKKIR